MIIAGIYSFNGGKEIVESKYASQLREVEQVIASIDSLKHMTKASREKTKTSRTLYSPSSLNTAFKIEFEKRNWRTHRVKCDYPTEYYTAGYTSSRSSKGAFREIDFAKNRLGVEILFKKYALMVYNVCAKMTIFHNLDLIDVGIEVVPVKDFVSEMSSGVSYFEQFIWDLERRGIADIDIPVLILGVAA